MRMLLGLFLLAAACRAETVALAGVREPVEILRDRWGVPHIYARNAPDLFFAQGYTAARDRLFQLDLWRRINTGRLAEVLGPDSVERDRIARLMVYRGDWKREWESYAPDARAIIESFAAGINAYIRSLQGRRTAEFAKAGYDPGLWSAEDCVARIAGLGVTSNLAQEIRAALAVAKLGPGAGALEFLFESRVEAGNSIRPRSRGRAQGGARPLHCRHRSGAIRLGAGEQ